MGLSAGVLLAAVWVAACMPLPPEVPAEPSTPLPEPSSPLFSFLATAAANQAGPIVDPRSGLEVRVVAGRSYHAASGRLCRRFQVTPPQSYEGLTEGLACRDERGRWSLSQLLINPDDLDAPRLRYP